MYGYGGDFGDQPNDGNFCMDGLVYPDRRPHTGLLEYKNVLRPIRARLDPTDAHIVILKNMLDFTDFANLGRIHYEVTCNGKIIADGELPPMSIAPHQEVSCQIAYVMPQQGDVYLRLIYRSLGEVALFPKGNVLGFDQLCIRKEAFQFPPFDCGEVSLRQEGELIRVETENGIFGFNRQTGLLDYVEKGGKQLLEHPMEYNVWRAPTDNDAHIKQEWYGWGLDRILPRVYSCDAEIQNGVAVLTAQVALTAVSVSPAAHMQVTWIIDAQGRCRIRLAIQRNTDISFLPRFGIRLFLPQTLNNVDYLGFGPVESYPDKHRASWYGRFNGTVEDMHEDYIRPQENGSHYACRWMDLEGIEAGVTVQGDDFSFNVSSFTQEELTQKRHNYELCPSGCTVLCLDYRQSGVGSNSCGPQLMQQYRLDEASFVCEFDILFRA